MKKLGNKGISFFASILAVLVFGSMGLTTVSILTNNLTGATDSLEGTQAFYVAEGGLQHTVMNELVGDPNFNDNISPTDAPFGANSISLGEGEFWVEYLNQSPDSVDTRITARVDKAVRVVRQTATKEYKYIALTGGNITSTISDGSITGDLGLQGSVTIANPVNFSGQIVQFINMNLPTANMAEIKNMTTETYVGSKTFTGNNNTGNLYVTGDVNFDGQTTFSGILYVDGDVNFLGPHIDIAGTIAVEGNFNANSTEQSAITAQPVDATSHMPAIICLGNVNLQYTVNVDIYGLVWSTGMINLFSSLNLDVQGSLISGGNLILDDGHGMNILFNKTLITNVPGIVGINSTVSTIELSRWKFN